MNGPDGLQAERTAMAWQRTALGLGGVSALLLHHAGGKVAPSVPGAAGPSTRGLTSRWSSGTAAT